jgi:hypothetical protein
MPIKIIINLIFTVIFASSQLTIAVAADYSARDYGTKRQPRKCADRKQPVSGKISVEQAKIYVTCEYEDKPPANASIPFVDILKLEIAPKTRAVTTKDIMQFTDIDQDKPIYMLQGSVKVYYCANVAGSNQKAGSNCIIFHQPRSKGTCHQTSFGDWHCFIGGRTEKEKRNQPAPT